MGTSEIIIMLLASIGVILGFFFAFSLIAVHNRMPRAKIFLILFLLFYSLRFAKSIVLYYNPMNIQVKNFLLMTLLAVGPSLFLYTKQMLNREALPNKKEILLHYTLFIVLEILAILIRDFNVSYVLYISLNIHIACYALHSLYHISKNSRNAPLNIVHWLNALNLVTLSVVTFSLLRGPVIPLPYIAMTIVYSIAIIFLAFWAIRNLDLFKNRLPKYPKSTIKSDDVKKYMTSLTQIMQNEKLYLDPNLNLSKLSSKLSISSKELSQVINQATQKNYSKYIASLRINEAKRLLQDEATRHIKIAAIAYDSGFNSLSSFNSAFKQMTGMTASEFRNQSI